MNRLAAEVTWLNWTAAKSAGWHWTAGPMTRTGRQLKSTSTGRQLSFPYYELDGSQSTMDWTAAEVVHAGIDRSRPHYELDGQLSRRDALDGSQVDA
ncbi:hypothetical protein CYMTET_49456 [Cymbomonas tetramitiformis]|uniref:Uncharacterized protein n=1 Tax=Cymbomonas tetramitiformis TaxID=36881 RepID=A0AAE0BQ48_9CHLO|nr:hypothetical protein CYMTET_49456 [Cymbomonas tetramitiformis]